MTSEAIILISAILGGLIAAIGIIEKSSGCFRKILKRIGSSKEVAPEQINITDNKSIKEIEKEPGQVQPLISLCDRLVKLISRYEVDWLTEEGLEPIKLDNAKRIIENLLIDLLNYHVQVKAYSNTAPPAQTEAPLLLEKIEGVILLSKKLLTHKIYVDMGKSKKEFWKQGDSIFNELKAIYTTLNNVCLNEELLDVRN